MSKKRKTKVSYTEGDVVAVPLKSGGFAQGLVARKGPDGDLLMYFFGPRRETVPHSVETPLLRNLACAAWRTCDDGIAEGKWPIIGTLDDFQYQEWPMPPYTRTCDITGRKTIVYFRDDDPFEVASERDATDDEVATLDRAGLKFCSAVEGGLDRLLKD